MYDLPAVVQYVVRETGQQQVQYVGFSMGTSIMFVMSTLRPDVARHVKLFTALGPVAALTHSRSRTFQAIAMVSSALMVSPPGAGRRGTVSGSNVQYRERSFQEKDI